MIFLKPYKTEMVRLTYTATNFEIDARGKITIQNLKCDLTAMNEMKLHLGHRADLLAETVVK